MAGLSLSSALTLSMSPRAGGGGGGPASPVFSQSPSISGGSAPNDLLVGSDGVISNGQVSARQWLRDGSVIATGPSYRLTDADIGTSITYRVSAVNVGGGSAQASSLAVLVTNPFAINDGFVANVSGWSNDVGAAPTWNNAIENSQLSVGCLSLVASAQTSRTFTAPTTGKVMCEFHFRDDSTTTDAGTAATTNIWIRLNALAVSSANSAAYIGIDRSTGNGATSNQVLIGYRNGGSFSNLLSVRRDGQVWWKIGVLLNVDANTYDIYLNDVLWIAGAAFPSTTKTTGGTITIGSNASAPQTFFDMVRVNTAWTPPAETTLISDDFTVGTSALSDTAPTDNRNINTQKWVSPTNTTVGAFTRSANGLTYTNKSTFALVRCGQEGVITTRWVMSAAGGRYAGILFRAWEGPDAGLGASTAMQTFRYASGSANQLVLLGFNGTTYGTIASRAAPTMTINPSDVIDLRVEYRGRKIDCYLRNVTAGGSFVLQFSHTVTSVATGGRGIHCQENAGPYCAGNFSGVGMDNYCTSFTYTGRRPSFSDSAIIGDLTFNVEAGSIKEMYAAESGEPTTNLFWDRGIQFGHRAEQDMAGSYNVVRSVAVSGVNVKAWRQRGVAMSEVTFGGVSDSFVTLLRRGPWVADHMFAWGTENNWAPDNDFRPGPLETTGSYKIINTAGSISTLNFLPYHDWRQDQATVYPSGMQTLASLASAPARMTIAIRNIQNSSAINFVFANKVTGSGAPISMAHGTNFSTLADATPYIQARAWLVQAGTGLTLDDTTLTQWRNDVNTPASLSFTTGTLKVNASGDLDTDGFNERHGWHEIDCASGVASFTLLVPSGKRFGPAFRLWSHTVGAIPTVTIAGVAGVSGTDFVWDDFGDGTGLLQLLSDRTADTTIAVA